MVFCVFKNLRGTRGEGVEGSGWWRGVRDWGVRDWKRKGSGAYEVSKAKCEVRRRKNEEGRTKNEERRTKN